MGLRAGLGMGPRAPDFDVNPGIKNNDRFFQGSRRLWKSVRKQTRNAIRYRVSPPPSFVEDARGWRDHFLGLAHFPISERGQGDIDRLSVASASIAALARRRRRSGLALIGAGWLNESIEFSSY